MFHRARHQDRILGFGNRGVHQNAITAKFHGLRRIGGCPDASVDNDWHARLLNNQADIERVLDAEA